MESQSPLGVTLKDGLDLKPTSQTPPPAGGLSEIYRNVSKILCNANNSFAIVVITIPMFPFLLFLHFFRMQHYPIEPQSSNETTW